MQLTTRSLLAILVALPLSLQAQTKTKKPSGIEPPALSPALQKKLVAQNPPTPRGRTVLPNGVPRPPAAPGAPGGDRNPTGRPTTEPSKDVATSASITTDNPWGELSFPGVPLEEVLAKYEEVTGRHLIRDPNLVAEVVILSNPNPHVPMTREEGTEFVKASLLVQGFNIQPYSKNIDKVVAIAAGGMPPMSNPPKEGAMVYTGDMKLPEGDEIINYVLKLAHLPVTDAVTIFQNAVPAHPWAKITAVPSANAIIIQEAASNVRSLINMAKEVDLTPAKVIHEWVELERATAEDVETMLTALLQQQSGAKSGGAASGLRLPTAGAAVGLGAAAGAQGATAVVAGAPGGGGGGNFAMADGSSMIIKADPRTNRVFLNGPVEHVTFLKMLIEEFDEPSRVKNLLNVQLRYVPVSEFFNTAATALEATGAGQRDGGGAGGATTPSSTNRSQGASTGRTSNSNFSGGSSGFGSTSSRSSGGFGGSSGGFGGSSGGFGGGGGGFGGGGGGGFGGGGSSSGGAVEQGQSVTIGKTLLISDPRTNSIIVSGPPDSIDRVNILIKELDKRPYQVHINAVIAQMGIDNNLSTGIDFLRKVEDLSVFGQKVSAGGLFRSSGGNNFIDPSTLDTLAGFPASASGFNMYLAAGELFSAYTRALETTGRSRLLAKPHVTVANNETAIITSGDRVPIPDTQQSSVVNGGSTAVNSSIRYEDVTLGLQVQPLINSRNEITLTINQQNNSISGSSNVGGQEVPTISTQTLNTRIAVPNGAILVLGGLLSDGDRKSGNGIPVLSRIPIFKHIFGSNTKAKQRRELLILLQARIIENASDMVDITANEVQRSVVGASAEQFARPEPNTSNLVLPTFEKDVPFDEAGKPPGSTKKSIFKRIGEKFRSRDGTD